MKINGKNYVLPEIDFKTVCDLEDYGVTLESMNKKIFKTILAFVTLAVGDENTAVNEIQAHLAKGGTFDPIMQEINDGLKSSGFFQALNASAAARSPEGAEPPEQTE